MMELIPREEAMRLLKDDLDASRSRGDDERADACLLHYIEISNLPTVEERKEGRWIDHKRLIMTDPEIWGYSQECSLCGFVLGAKEYNYCPNCGARMKGE